jgi:hypothetical protein
MSRHITILDLEPFGEAGQSAGRPCAALSGVTRGWLTDNGPYTNLQ